jgi:hypothetical protein
MAPIRTLLLLAARRLAAVRFLRAVAWSLAGAATLSLLLVLLERSSPAVALPWRSLLVAMAAVVVVAGLAWMRLTRPSEVELAVLVDERLGLKERLSTALAVRERADPFARAACEDATRIAADRAVRERAGRAFPVRAGRECGVAAGVAALAVAAYLLVPQGDLFSPEEAPDRTELVAVRTEADAAMAEILRKVEESPALAAELRQKGEIGDAAPRPDERAPEPKATPDEARREAIRRMNELQRKLEEIAKGEQALATEALRQQLAKLEVAADAETKELAEALHKGDFAAAKAAFETLREEAAKKGDAERQELEKKLNELAQQVGQLAENREQLEEALRKAGLDPAAAGNPEAMKQAIENAKNLTEAQKEQLRKAVQSQEAAQKKLKELEQQLKQCSSGMCRGGGQKQGSPGQQGQSGGQQPGESGQQGSDGAGGTEAMLSELEMARQMAEAAEAAANEAASQSQGMGEGLGQMAGACKSDSESDQVSMIDGIRQGGRGRAAGGKTPTAPTPTGTRLVKEKTKLQKGDIIARQLVEGEVEIGEAAIPVAPAEGEVDAAVEGGVSEDRVPTHLKDVHKHYFGELRKRIEAKQKAASP